MQSLFLDKFFSLLLEISYFYYLVIFKYSSFSSVNSLAPEFQFFYMLYSYFIIMQSLNIKDNPETEVGGGVPCLFVSEI